MDRMVFVFLNMGLSAIQYLPVSLRRTQRNPPSTRGMYSATCISRRRRSCHILNLVLDSQMPSSLHSEVVAAAVAAALSLKRSPWDGELHTSALGASERAEIARRRTRYPWTGQVVGGHV